ncbi:MAG TPA: CdaR family protein [Candidatus Dormibacteraeota bacterium]|jgi:YbbR domain-containing protein|nr:CdaR family protein [Candidatus Dormibacteraeota bacterium]
MSWLVGNWRLKLLSLVLALALLAAVAFSENPPSVKTVSVGLSYQNLPTSLVVIDPPQSVPVTVAGLAESVRQFQRQTQVGAVVDLTGATSGDHTYQAEVSGATDGVTVETPRIPLHLRLDSLVTRQLPIRVHVTDINASLGISLVSSGTYATCGNDAEACQVTVTAPASLLNGLSAYVEFDLPISSAGTERAPYLPVHFERGGRQVDLATVRTLPQINFAPTRATARVETQGGVFTKQVAITLQATGQPACGYTIQSLSISPSTFATISGPTSALTEIQSVSTAPINLSGLAQSQTYVRSLQTGSSSVGVVSPSGGAVEVTVVVVHTYSCSGGTQPTPTPSPKATPSPSPTPTTP